jgi:hypothetical protein
MSSFFYFYNRLPGNDGRGDAWRDSLEFVIYQDKYKYKRAHGSDGTEELEAGLVRRFLMVGKWKDVCLQSGGGD